MNTGHSPLVAHKFGGSSLADAARIERVARILAGRRERQVVVVSAMQGATDALIGLARRAAARDAAWPQGWTELRERHRDAGRAIAGPAADGLLALLDDEFARLRELLHAQALVGHLSDDLLDLIQGLGEVWSSLLVQAALRARGLDCVRLDARDTLVVEHGELGATVDWDESRAKLALADLRGEPRVVVTGFVARTKSGRVTTLGRNGSDYSGAIFAALFGASELHIWTDVDGVLSADPRVVPEARLVERLSYDEACELSYFGAKVIHPQTMAPAIARGIPIVIRNTFNPDHPGTSISSEPSQSPPVKGVTTFAGLALLDIAGAGMMGVPGTAERAFSALKQAGVSVVMISQGSSEHSICCVIREKDAPAAERAVREAFGREIDRGQMQGVSTRANIAALAVVGDGMAGTPGTAARLFAALGRARVNVRAIAQGASERNISVAIDAADATRALRAVHAGYYLSAQTISIGLVGPGNVGAAFVRQLAATRERLLRDQRIDLRLRAIATSRAMWLGESGATPLEALEALRARPEPLDMARFADHVRADHVPHAVMLDCSASGAVADLYASWLARGIHVVVANKQAGAGDIARHQAIRAAEASGGARWRYEATVGAGLPILCTLRDLVDTGDELHSIEGILSGTLAWLFNHHDGATPFSALVRRARHEGYTEPDPRDDLSGLDVARKLVILARECGWTTSLADVQVEGLVPAELAGIPLEEFLSRLEELDERMAARLAAAKSRGKLLRYAARLTREGEARVGVVEVPADHALAHGRSTDNLVQFTTGRYRANPLVVRGPGAGPEVTAAGVYADLLRIAAGLGSGA